MIEEQGEGFWMGHSDGAGESAKEGVGRETYLTRVEAWECDFNGHWNTRFFGEAFAQAANVTAAWADTHVSAGSMAWHLRFHHELFAGSVVSVHSSSGGGTIPSTIHALMSDGRIAATAVQTPAPIVSELPKAGAALLEQALPRGLPPQHIDWHGLAMDPQRTAPLGIIHAQAFDDHRRLKLGDLLTLCGRGAHDHRMQIGFGPTFAKEANLGCMLVEMRVVLLPEIVAGAPVSMRSRLISVEAKSFRSAHIIVDQNGAEIARVELCLLVVDLATRRATKVPDQIYRQL